MTGAMTLVACPRMPVQPRALVELGCEGPFVRRVKKVSRREADEHQAPSNAQGRDRIDRHVGVRIARTREFRGLSRETLAAALCVSIARVAAYEGGSARIDARTLREIGRILNVRPSFFLRGLAGNLEPLARPNENAAVGGHAEAAEPSLRSVIDIFESIQSRTTRQMLLDLMVVITSAEGGPQRWLM